MTPERWSRIRHTFDRVVDEPPASRAALVQAAHPGDLEIQAEILHLLHAHDTSEDFLESAAGDLHAILDDIPTGPAFQVGAVLARRFQVRAFIAAGGMGEVYEAWDRELNETVAIKTILPHIAAQAEVINRFKHEVRHAREVSHSNICRVHELFCDESTGGARTWFLSMELLRGTTLMQYLRSHGPLPPRRAQTVAAQLLAGLGAAHARGLVHRDFKSSNIMLLNDEDSLRAVIMDFGLAIAHASSGDASGGMAGTGTPGYMPPEQERGEAVGPLADQYALGVVLCEIMTGAPPGRRLRLHSWTNGLSRFKSNPRPAQDPDATPSKSHAQPAGYPAQWATVIRRCTQPEAAQRYPSIAAVQAALLPSFWRRNRPWLVLAALAVAAGVALAVQRYRAAQPRPCSICQVAQLTPDTDKAESPSLSADGKYVAYSSDRAETGNLDIFVQPVDSGSPRRITVDASRDTTPSLSPDGRLVAYRSEIGGGGIFIAPTGVAPSLDNAAHAAPRMLVPFGRNPRISPDGRSVLYWTGDPDSSEPSGKVFRVSIAGGAPQQVASAFADARYPVWSEDGNNILFTGCKSIGQLLPDCFDWWVAGTATVAIAQTHAFDSLRQHGFQPGRLNSLDWKNGQLVFSAIGDSKRLNLAAVSLHPTNFSLVGPPQWLLQGTSGDLEPSISSDRRIAFTRTTGALHVWKIDHILDRKKSPPQKVTVDAEVDGSPFVTESGRYLVFARGRTRRRVVLMLDTATGEETTIVDQGTAVLAPIMDSAGSWVAYQQTETDGASAIYAGQRGGPMRRICLNCTDPSAWLDGNKAFFFRSGAHGISLVDPRTAQQQVIFNDPAATIGEVAWSQDNHSMLLAVSRAGLRQIVIIRLDPQTNQQSGSELSVTETSGTPIHPKWFNGGKGIVYASNRDGFTCIYQRSYNRLTNAFGDAVAVAHFHNQRASIDDVVPRVFNLSASGDTVYFNLGEQNSTVELGRIRATK